MKNSPNMTSDCILFLQWALPQLNLRWAGFRKVHRQVCKRIRRRIQILQLQDYAEYQDWILRHPEEWPILDNMCRITISRFYRDWAVFDYLRKELLPQLARRVIRENRPLYCWSAGCASGEEAYTLALIWYFELRERFPELKFRILATDVDTYLLDRAKRGCYPMGNLKGLPHDWRAKAFTKKENEYCLKSPFKTSIEWNQQDIRKSLPTGKFDLILCRNLVATYFSPDLQVATFERLKSVLRADGYLLLGCHEKLPDGLKGFSVEIAKLQLYKLTTKHEINHKLY